MKLSVGITKTGWKGLTAILLICSGLTLIAFSQSQTIKKHSQSTLNRTDYISAFARKFPETFCLPPDPAAGDSIKYTIQICTLNHALQDPFLTGQYKIRILQMGELYRYLFSEYTTLASACKDLPLIRKIFPQACIREYRQHKIGKIVDPNIDNKNK